MVNRVLIRIKVVQMLYSYLLTRSEFKIDDAPEAPTRDKQYAYSTYLDMFLLLLELSGRASRNGEKPVISVVTTPLANNKAAKAIASNNVILESKLRQDKSRISKMLPLVPELYDKLVKSEVYADYAKKKDRSLADDIVLWTTVFDTIVARNNGLKEALRAEGDFSNQGFMTGIISMCSTLKDYADSKEFYAKAQRDLAISLDKAYELYLSIFALIIDITNEQQRRIEAAKDKHLATSDDLNPNTKLVRNLFVDYLKNNEGLAELFKSYGVKRNDIATPLINSLLDQILSSKLYADYCEKDDQNLKEDAEFWRDALKSIVFQSDFFLEELENSSVFWNDDLQTMGTFVLKTIRQIGQANTKAVEMLPKFKDLDDERFGPELFRFAVENQDEYRGYIDKFIKSSHWDLDRIPYMDIVIMTTAIAEIIHYPSIPIPVSVNEYVEIASAYSTDRSAGFVNGILYNIVKYLKEEGKINK